MPNFYLFLIQCIKLARSAIYTLGNIIFIFSEFVIIFIESLFTNSSSFSIDIFKQDSNLFDDDNDSNDDDIFDIFSSQRGGNKFMNKYSVNDVQNIIKNTVISDRLKKVGFSDWYVEFDLIPLIIIYTLGQNDIQQKINILAL